jgi:hypothetical protein
MRGKETPSACGGGAHQPLSSRAASVSAEMKELCDAVDAIISCGKSRCSQWEPKQLPLVVGWFSSSGPSSVLQPRRSRATATTLGVTMRFTITPRSCLTRSVLALGALTVRVTPSVHRVGVSAGRPSAARGVRGVPSWWRKSAQESVEKPSACRSSCT